MPMRLRILACLLCVAAVARGADDPARPWTLQAEVDAAEVTSNTLQRPDNAAGSRFDVSDLSARTTVLERFSLTRRMDLWQPDVGLRLEVIPFQQSGTASLDRSIRFNGVTFPAGSPLTVLYQFNTYRLTIDAPVFTTVDRADWSFRVGGTLAVRDAQVRLKAAGARANFINWGPVPLAYASAAWRVAAQWSLHADIDGFPAPGGGGLLDTSARITWAPRRDLAVSLGIRYEAGGARGDTFFNFLHQRSALASVAWSF
jgi:hypothetical protein